MSNELKYWWEDDFEMKECTTFFLYWFELIKYWEEYFLFKKNIQSIRDLLI